MSIKLTQFVWLGFLVSACGSAHTPQRECPRGSVYVESASYTGGEAFDLGFYRVSTSSGIAAYRPIPESGAAACVFECAKGSTPNIRRDSLVCEMDDHVTP